MPDFEIKPTKVKVKEITIHVEGTPAAKAKVFVETCNNCGAEAAWVPTTVVRPHYKADWRVNGAVPPEGWKEGKCARCLAAMAAMGG